MGATAAGRSGGVCDGRPAARHTRASGRHSWILDPEFIGGTGTEQLQKVRKDYGVTATKIPAGGSYVYDHSSFIYLIDRAGRIRALMPYGHPPDDFAHDLHILLGE